MQDKSSGKTSAHETDGPRAIRQLTPQQWLEALQRLRFPYQAHYLAMYASDLDAIVTDPALMRVPVDDHMVHRGDGVFEVCKCVRQAVYNFEAHLARLEHSAAAIDLKWQGGRDAIRARCLATLRAAGCAEGVLRILLSRGPGGFGVDPYECPAPSLYIVVTTLTAPFMTRHPEGATVRRSRIPAKPAWVAGVKNCNYLPNVLMKKEAVEMGVDFVVGIDHNGCLTEGATENVGIVTREGELRFPRLDQVLRGTTMDRVLVLAQSLVDAGRLRGVAFGDIPESMVLEAPEMVLAGTSINVVAVRDYEGRPVGTGRPGPVWAALDACLRNDVERNAALRTPFGTGACGSV